MTTTKTTTTSTRDAIQAANGLTDTVRQAAGTVADAAGTAAGEVGARLPAVAATARDALSEADRVVRNGSDDTLRLVGVAAVGFAVGLLVGGAPRAIVLGALLPVGLIGVTLLDREGASGATPARLR